MNSPAFQRLMSLLTGVLSDSNYALMNSDVLRKQILKDFYGILIEIMGLSEQDALDYLHFILDATHELIIEHTQNISVVDLGVVQGELFNGARNSGEVENSAGTERTSIDGRENEIRKIDSSPSDSDRITE